MIDFSEVQNSVRALKEQLATDQIDEKTFEDHLLELIDLAEDGYYWMYDHESEQWFRHDGQDWVVDNPDRILAQRAQAKSAANYDTEFEPDALEELPVNPVWFTVSLAVLVFIGAIIYVSTLA